jgi:hypothetical protein
VTGLGTLKWAVRSWLDSHLDNGAMLGIADPLLGAFAADGSRSFCFGAGLDAMHVCGLARGHAPIERRRAGVVSFDSP